MELRLFPAILFYGKDCSATIHPRFSGTPHLQSIMACCTYKIIYTHQMLNHHHLIYALNEPSEVGKE